MGILRDLDESAHLHAGGQFGVGAAKSKHFGADQILLLVLHLVVGDDLEPCQSHQHFARQQPIESALFGGFLRVVEEFDKMLQFEGVRLAALDPGVKFLQAGTEFLVIMGVVGEEGGLVEGVVFQQVAAQSFRHVYVLLELRTIN